ncbi:MAG: RagB/SusD family nutrient uptake outer membrane protein [Parabacteroides sp.]|jgi:starch-binding outer membrane protein, SusD/RagB family|nr:RagB/SusD family nutrient uptake outer membrane protein [Parabacteroides sp.]MBP9482046.1 RagB/SusD family nutrient uptake outer membrane protein [Parabacteroides sp.]MBP9578787.1 RagB/SusD family nutrient uptake outer membrane protein [Parabacteroides sp.]MDD2416205.1 RagB/SusD family nutrient uptake outer membrane protein [Parabacteroides sp.]
MKTIQYILTCCSLSAVLFSCDTFLDENPKGVLSNEQLNTPENVEKMVIAAYSSLGNDHYTEPNSPWPYGDLRSGDAYKGGAGTGDMQEFHFYETFTYLRDDIGLLDSKWYKEYVDISRANNALARLNTIDEADFSKKTTRIAEMRFLRAHYYFELKLLFKQIPYIDENVPVEEYINVSNVELTSQQLWDKIIEEFRFAAQTLPENNAEIGRANKWMAKAYLAKALLYAAYEQDEKHNVTNINKEKLTEVVSLTNEIIASGKYALNADYADNFLCETENSKESVFAVQHSRNDGTLHGRLDWGAMLNYPMNPEYGCCGFHQASQNLVNAFQTDDKGLPKFAEFNSKNLNTPDDLLENNVDPRLNHTVAIPGLPYKYNPEFVFEAWWNRQPEVYGSFMSLKEVVLPDCPCFEKVNPFMSSSKNRDIIRFDDVLLWNAEALIELGRETEALPVINSIRERAGNSTARLVDVQGDPTGKFVVGTYQPGVNCTWTNDFARQALRWERRMEFAMEGVRFFDLVRWGIAAEYLNSYFMVEKTRREHLREAKFTKNRDEYFPIPKQQINFSKKLYVQNYGW